MATLTYVYSDSNAVLGPLAASAEPHSYDLCERHAARLTAPRGWTMVRLEPSTEDYGGKVPQFAEDGATERSEFKQRQMELSKPVSQPNDDWAVLADAVRAQKELLSREPKHALPEVGQDPTEVIRRGHLRVLRGEG